MSSRKKVSMSVPTPRRTEVSASSAALFEAGGATKPAELTVTTIRLTKAQHNALRRAALARAAELGGKADASAVVRGLLDQWIAQGSPLP